MKIRTMQIYNFIFLSAALLQSVDAKIRGGIKGSSVTIPSRGLKSSGTSSDDKNKGSSGSSMGSSDSMGSMGSSGSMSSESSGSFSGSADLGVGECEICSSEYKVRPNSITFQYSRESGTSKHQDKSTCVGRSELFPEFANILANGQDFQVSAGDTFTVFGSFEAWTDMLITNVGFSCELHTSCSQPLVAGDQFGPFKILSGGDTCSGTFTGSDGGDVGGCSGSSCNSDRDPAAGGSSSNNNGECEICSKDYKVRPEALTLQYLSNGQTSRYQDRATCLGDNYPLSSRLTFEVDDGRERQIDVFNGMTFTIDGPFEANTIVNIDGYGECAFHTSCSQPLVAGDQIGPFLVVGGGRCATDPDPPSGGSSPIPPSPTPPGPYPPGDCEICYKKGQFTERPHTLYVQYFADGQTSDYQDADKASCRQASYPPGTQLQFTVDNDITRFFGNVQDGQILTLEGPFDAYTYVDIAGWGSCFFHTSCSQPLVAGDRIGPFQIISSDDRCKVEQTRPPFPPPVPPPTIAPFDPPSGGLADTPSPTPAPTPAPTPDPTPSPTAHPTPDPTPAPTPELTPGPTPNPTLAPIPSPSASPSDAPTSSPSNKPSVQRSEIPSPSPSDRPTPVASESPSSQPSGAPTPIPCIRPDKATYQCGEAIVVDYNFDDAFADDWIGIYPCETNVYLHSEVWQWACGTPGCADPSFSGTIVFDGLPTYNQSGPHTWPVAPYKDLDDGTVHRCFKIVYLREDGPSVPPYNAMCESIEFTIQENETDGCSIRPENLNVIGDDE